MLLHIDTVNAALGLLINLAEGSSTHRQSLQTLRITTKPDSSSQSTTAVGLLAHLMQVGQSYPPASCLIGGQALCWRRLVLLLLHGLEMLATLAAARVGVPAGACITEE